MIFGVSSAEPWHVATLLCHSHPTAIDVFRLVLPTGYNDPMTSPHLPKQIPPSKSLFRDLANGSAGPGTRALVSLVLAITLHG